jgi:hypothetical protein
MKTLILNGYSDVFKRPIFVVGLPNGGTTLTARLIRDMGVWTGPTLDGPRSDPKDLLENRMIRDKLIKPTLKHMKCDPNGIKTLPNPKRRMNLVFPTKEGNIQLKERLNRMVQGQGYDHALRWMYKDPRLALLWPSFAEDFPKAEWVIVKRCKRKFIHSCLAAPHMRAQSDNAKFWSRFWREYSQRLDMLKDHAKYVHEVQFEHIEEGNLSEMKSISDSIGINFSRLKQPNQTDPARWRHS